MSHFVVVVAIPPSVQTAAEAEDMLEKLLARWDENASATPYPNWVDDKEVNRAVGFYRENPQFCTEGGNGPEKPFDEFVTEGNLEAFNEWIRQAVGGYCAGGRDDGLLDPEHGFGYLSTYNPDSKWDWWTLGGRWNGFFHLKPKVKAGSQPLEAWRASLGVVGDGIEGAQTIPNADETSEAILGNAGVGGNDPNENFAGRGDLARKRDIDFETQRTLAAQAADAKYDKFEEVTKGLEIPPRWQEFHRTVLIDHEIDPDAEFSEYTDEQRERYREVMDIARKRYAEFEWNKALREHQLTTFFGDDHEDFKVYYDDPRAAYVEQARLDAARAWGLVINGEWYEKGRMGWFGMSSGDKDELDWAREYWRLIDSLPEDTWLAAVDCHI